MSVLIEFRIVVRTGLRRLAEIARKRRRTLRIGLRDEAFVAGILLEDFGGHLPARCASIFSQGDLRDGAFVKRTELKHDRRGTVHCTNLRNGAVEIIADLVDRNEAKFGILDGRAPVAIADLVDTDIGEVVPDIVIGFWWW